MKKIVSLAALSAGATLAGPLSAAEPCYLTLKAAGSAVDGEVVQKGREKTIECVAFESEVTQARDASGLSVGKRTWAAIKCTKRVDKTSALFLKAMVQNQTMDATFKFYRPVSLDRGGAEEQFYTVTLKGARIGTIKQVSPNATHADTKPQPFQEEVSFVFDARTTVDIASGPLPSPNVASDGATAGK